MDRQGARKTVMTTLATAVAGVAMLAPSALLPASAAAGSHGVLPKGTPYAAEVIATIGGESHIVRAVTATTFNVCEAESQIADGEDEYDFRWKARYPQVTVPVASAEQLGRAYKRLHVRVQPTSDGRGGLTEGTFHFSGHSPPTNEGNQGAGGSDCAKQPFDASGTFTATHPTFADLTYKAFEGPRRLFDFDLGSIDSAAPAAFTLPDGSQADPLANLSEDAEAVPTTPAVLNVPPEYDSVPASFDISKLMRLAHSPSITIYRRTSGSHDCGTPADDFGELKCGVEWNYQFRVKLTRRFLYRTKADYAR
jgi:hypothetical protein